MLTERSVELPWLIANIGRPKRILDIGSADATYLHILFEMCRELYLCDTRRFDVTVPARQVHVGSAHQLPATWGGMFDLVTCVSVLDHVGLDAYGNTTDDNLLNAVIEEIERVIVPSGRLLLTVPFGRAQVTTHPSGGQRIFDLDTLGGLFDASAWRIISANMWRLQDDHYVDSSAPESANAGYAQWRAEACIALELVKL